jgi:anti-anti-sigma factor
LPTALIEAETQCVIRMEGDVDIANAAELKTMLIAAISSGKEVQIDLEGASDLDVTAVQLLWSAAREAGKAGSSFAAVHVPEVLRSSMSELGLPDFPAELAVTAPISPAPAEERR